MHQLNLVHAGQMKNVKQNLEILSIPKLAKTVHFSLKLYLIGTCRLLIKVLFQ